MVRDALQYYFSTSNYFTVLVQCKFHVPSTAKMNKYDKEEGKQCIGCPSVLDGIPRE